MNAFETLKDLKPNKNLEGSNQTEFTLETTQKVERGFENLSWDAELLTRWLRRYYNVDIELAE